MFEKEAEEYLKKDGTKAEQILDMLNEISPLKITLKQVPFILAMIQQVFKDGAEFGYNKCDEQLINAKEIIKKLYSHVFQGMGFMEINDYNVQKAEAEQFISEVEKRKTGSMEKKSK